MANKKKRMKFHSSAPSLIRARRSDRRLRFLLNSKLLTFNSFSRPSADLTKPCLCTGKIGSGLSVCFFSTFCVVMRSESPNLSEGSDSTNYLTTVSVERYNNRPPSSIHRSTTVDGNNHHRTARYTPSTGQEEFHRTSYSNSLSKSIDPQVNYRSAKSKRSVEWDEENIQKNEGRPFSLTHSSSVTSDPRITSEYNEM